MKNLCICKHCSKSENKTVSALQTACVIFSVLSFILSAASFIYIVFGDKLCRSHNDFEDYDYDPSDIYDDEELKF